MTEEGWLVWPVCSSVFRTDVCRWDNKGRKLGESRLPRKEIYRAHTESWRREQEELSKCALKDCNRD